MQTGLPGEIGVGKEPPRFGVMQATAVQEIVLERFDVLKIQSIDTVSQSFYARCFVRLRLIGAKDRQESFVTFSNGAIESAEWFAKQRRAVQLLRA